jgi:hypothetical protein
MTPLTPHAYGVALAEQHTGDLTDDQVDSAARILSTVGEPELADSA